MLFFFNWAWCVYSSAVMLLMRGHSASNPGLFQGLVQAKVPCVLAGIVFTLCQPTLALPVIQYSVAWKHPDAQSFGLCFPLKLGNHPVINLRAIFSSSGHWSSDHKYQKQNSFVCFFTTKQIINVSQLTMDGTVGYSLAVLSQTGKLCSNLSLSCRF